MADQDAPSIQIGRGELEIVPKDDKLTEAMDAADRRLDALKAKASALFVDIDADKIDRAMQSLDKIRESAIAIRDALVAAADARERLGRSPAEGSHDAVPTPRFREAELEQMSRGVMDGHHVEELRRTADEIRDLVLEMAERDRDRE